MSFDQLLFAGESQTLEYKSSFEVSLEVKEIGAGVELIFKRISNPDEPQQNSELENGSEKSSEKILALLTLTVQMTTKELAEKLRIGQRAVEKQIEKLKREGLLQRIGPDKGGHWQVQKVDK